MKAFRKIVAVLVIALASFGSTAAYAGDDPICRRGDTPTAENAASWVLDTVTLCLERGPHTQWPIDP